MKRTIQIEKWNLKKHFLAGLLGSTVALFLLLPACGGKTIANAPSNGVKKISVYTSFYPMYDFAKKIGGDRISVVNLIPAGSEPHDWAPTPFDMVNLEKADILIVNGAGMEGWLDKIVLVLNNKNLKVLDTSKNIKLSGNQDKNEDLKFDPHVWLNPMNAKLQMKAIKDALSAVDPKYREYYERNYQANAEKLDELDREYRSTIAPLKNREIIVSHQAFGYLCAEYGLKQISIEGLAAESAPTPAKMVEIAAFAKKNHVRTIFFESLIGPKIALAIAKEAGANTAVLNPLEGLRDDEIRAGKEYFSVMRENLAQIKKDLE